MSPINFYFTTLDSDKPSDKVKLLIVISDGNRFYKEAVFSGIIELINQYQDVIEEVTIVDSHYLRRHSKGEKVAETNARAWKKANTQNMQSLFVAGKKYNQWRKKHLIDWKDLLGEKYQYPKHRQKVDEWYESDEEFRSIVDAVVEEFAVRYVLDTIIFEKNNRKRTQEMREWDFEEVLRAQKEILLEEIAMMWVLPQLGVSREAYAGSSGHWR